MRRNARKGCDLVTQVADDVMRSLATQSQETCQHKAAERRVCTPPPCVCRREISRRQQGKRTAGRWSTREQT